MRFLVRGSHDCCKILNYREGGQGGSLKSYSIVPARDNPHGTAIKRTWYGEHYTYQRLLVLRGGHSINMESME